MKTCLQKLVVQWTECFEVKKRTDYLSLYLHHKGCTISLKAAGPFSTYKSSLKVRVIMWKFNAAVLTQVISYCFKSSAFQVFSDSSTCLRCLCPAKLGVKVSADSCKQLKKCIPFRKVCTMDLVHYLKRKIGAAVVWSPLGYRNTEL
jgi:hypothetical protein